MFPKCLNFIGKIASKLAILSWAGPTWNDHLHHVHLGDSDVCLANLHLDTAPSPTFIRSARYQCNWNTRAITI
jgi:hypothetical protein